MPVKPFWFGVLLVLVPAAAVADPAPKVTPSPRSLQSPISQAVTLNGKTFPAVTPYVAKVPPPVRAFFVSASGPAGDGSAEHPWTDLQEALRALSPGDRLTVRPGTYAAEFRIDKACRDGSEGRPIQVFFDGKAKLVPRGELAVISAGRSHWYLSGPFVELGQTANTGISIDDDARGVTIDGARISGGAGPSIRVGGETAGVRIANSRIAKTRLEEANPQGIGIAIAAGARDVLITNNQMKDNPGGSLRVLAPVGAQRMANGVLVVSNTMRDDASAAIGVEAADGIRIVGNTILNAPDMADTRGIELGRVDRAIVKWNHVANCQVAIQVGGAGEGGELRQPVDVSIDHNYLEDAYAMGTGIRVDAANKARLVHNVVEGAAEAIVVRGAPPRTQALTVANNLVVGISRLAFVLEEPKAVRIFDYNVFSPAGDAVSVRYGKREVGLFQLLKEGVMPHSKVAPGVRFANRDLARVEGAVTHEQGVAVSGYAHRGAAPDIGLDER